METLEQHGYIESVKSSLMLVLNSTQRYVH